MYDDTTCRYLVDFVFRLTGAISGRMNDDEDLMILNDQLMDAVHAMEPDEVGYRFTPKAPFFVN